MVSVITASRKPPSKRHRGLRRAIPMAAASVRPYSAVRNEACRALLFPGSAARCASDAADNPVAHARLATLACRHRRSNYRSAASRQPGQALVSVPRGHPARPSRGRGPADKPPTSRSDLSLPHSTGSLTRSNSANSKSDVRMSSPACSGVHALSVTAEVEDGDGRNKSGQGARAGLSRK